METTDGNKLALAVLGTLLGTMALGVFSNAIYAPNRAVKPGYPLPAGTEATAPAAESGARDPLPRGTRQGRRRQGPGGHQGLPDLPFLREGRPDQGRSAALGRRRTPEGLVPRLRLFRRHEVEGRRLDLGGPQPVPDQAVGLCPRHQDDLPGEAEESKRADIVDYLHTLADNPLPLPTPAAAPRRRRQLRRSPSPAPTAAATPTPAPTAAATRASAEAHAGADSCGEAHAGADSCGERPRQRRQLRRRPRRRRQLR